MQQPTYLLSYIPMYFRKDKEAKSQSQEVKGKAKQDMQGMQCFLRNIMHVITCRGGIRVN